MLFMNMLAGLAAGDSERRGGGRAGGGIGCVACLH